MKMLIEEELSKERETWHRQPNAVAKLMGLDTIADQPWSTALPEDLTQTTCALRGNMQDNQKKGKIYLNRMLTHNARPLVLCANVPRTYKDISQSCHPCKSCFIKNEPLINEQYDDSSYDMRKALVTQKLLKSKYLASNQKLRHSKEFEHALKILSTNRELFLACLEEPNRPDYSQKVQRSTLPTHTKHITVPKPSGALDGRVDKKTSSYLPTLDDNYWRRNQSSCISNFIPQKPENLSHPTRIVVLKPNPGKQTETKFMVASIMSLEAKQSRGPGHLPVESTHQRQASFGQRDEALLSPMLSNGYAADASTVYVSGDECTVDECVTSSELESASPRSQHSCDSSSKASCLCESPVLREAKRRLSKRFDMVNSNRINHELEESWSTGTLGEVLAFPVMGKEGMASHIVASGPMTKSCYGETELRASSFSSLNEDNGGENNPMSLKRSKSTPPLLSIYEDEGLELEVPTLHAPKATSAKGKMKNVKSSFKGKVSNFFISHSKKFGLEKPSVSSPGGSNVQIQTGCNLSSGGSRNAHPMCYSAHGEDQSHNLEGNVKILGGHFPKASLLFEKLKEVMPRKIGVPQPSPISTFQVPLEDKLACDALESREGECPSGISRLPPIESVAQNLHAENSHPLRERLKHLQDLWKADIEEHERITFIKSPLSSIGIDSEMLGLSCRWHSLESPLDPALLEKFFECKEELAESREMRSAKRLLFDCINAVLLEAACAPACCTPLIEEVILRRLLEWFSSEGKLFHRSFETSWQIVDRIARKEVGGRGWAESVGSDMIELGGEIERQVLDQLLGEALDDFIYLCLR